MLIIARFSAWFLSCFRIISRRNLKGLDIMIKVLHIGEYVQGGVATYIKTLITKDREYGVDNYLFMSEDKSEHVWDFPADKIDYYPYHRSLFSLLPAMRMIHNHIRKIDPDIVFFHSSWAGMMGRVPFFCTKKRPRVIYNPHGWSFLMDVGKWRKRFYSLIENVLAAETDVIVDVSKHEYDCGVQYGLPKDKMRVIYSGIPDLDVSTPCEVKFSKEKINILFVGRFDRQKGLDILLDAFHKNRFPRLHLYVIGAPVISTQLNEYHNEENITFLGWIQNEAIGSYYRACDAVIMPSRWEGFSVVALEAMRYGKAILASDATSLPEQVEDGVNGCLFSLEDDVQLTKILQNLSADKLITMGKKAREFYCERFTSERMLNDFLNMYQSLVKDAEKP